MQSRIYYLGSYPQTQWTIDNNNLIRPQFQPKLSIPIFNTNYRFQFSTPIPAPSQPSSPQPSPPSFPPPLSLSLSLSPFPLLTIILTLVFIIETSEMDPLHRRGIDLAYTKIVRLGITRLFIPLSSSFSSPISHRRHMMPNGDSNRNKQYSRHHWVSHLPPDGEGLCTSTIT